MIDIARWDTLELDMTADKWSSVELEVKSGTITHLKQRIRSGEIVIDLEPWVYKYRATIITPKKVIRGDRQNLTIK